MIGRALAVVGLMVATRATAEPWGPPREADHVVAIAVALDGPARVDAGYGRTLRPGVLPGPLTVGGHLRLPSAPDLGDLELGATAALDLPVRGGWRVWPALGLAERRGDGALVAIDQLALIAAVSAGHVAPRWHAGITARWDHALATRVAPRNDYRRMVPTARVTWTAGGGGTLRVGVEGGARVAGDVELLARMGVLRSERLVAVPGLPIFAELGLAVRF